MVLKRIMSESSDEDFIIKDIDSPLYKYLFFYRIEIRKSFVSDRQKSIQKIKSIILSIYLFICIVRYGIHSLILVNKNIIPVYYLDIVQYYGGIPEFYYFGTIFLLLFCLRIIHILNHSNSKDYEWLKIIKALNELQSFNALKIYNKNETQKYVRRIKTLKFITQYVIYSILLFEFLLSFAVLFIFFDLSDLLKYGILSSLIYFFNCYIWFPLIGFSSFYYFIVCYYCKTRFKSFNNYIQLLLNEKNTAFLKYKTVDQLINYHNSICSDIKSFNNFWQKYYFSITYTLIPINLLLLQLVLFEELLLPLFCVTIIFNFGSMASHLMFNSITASINSEALRTYKSLEKIYLKMNFSLNTRRKLKVIKQKL